MACDWDKESSLIILNIMHLRNKKVPKTVSLDMLAKVGVLIDYHECGEALKMFTAIWISDITEIPLPTAICRDVVLWIWVAWVFELHEQFEVVTAVSIRKSEKAIDTLDLPIPNSVSSECSYPNLRSLLAML